MRKMKIDKIKKNRLILFCDLCNLCHKGFKFLYDKMGENRKNSGGGKVMKDMVFPQDRSKKYPYVKEPRPTSERETLADFIEEKND